MRLHLVPDKLDLQPGEPAALQVNIYNDRDIIDAFVVGLVDLVASSMVLEPKELSLFPGTEGSVTIVFTPATDLPAGARVVAVRVTSTTDPTHTQDVPLTVDVAARTELAFDVDPQTVNGATRADYGLIITNRGNTPLSVSLSGSDSERVLGCNVDRPRVDVAPGERSVARARVQGRRPWVGTPIARIITFKATAGTAEHQAMSTFIQRPLLSRGALTFLALLAAVAVWAVVLMAGFNRVATVQEANSIRNAEAIVGASTGEDGGGGGDGDGGGGGSDDGGGGGGGDGDGGGATAGDGVIAGQVLRGGAGPLAPSAPVTDVVVEARRVDQPDRLAAAAVTDGGGTFSLGGLAPGQYHVRAFGPGYAPVWWPSAGSAALAAPVVVGEDGQSTPIALTITGAPGSIAGVLNSEAGPLAGVVLSAGPGLPATVTDAAGGFMLQPLPTPATYQLTMTAPGFPQGGATITLGPGQQLAGQQLLLSSAAGVIAGTVTDGAGLPLGGVTLLLTDRANLPVAATVSFAQGAVGFFTLSGVPAPGSYFLTAMLNGYLTTTVPIELTAALPSLNVSVALPSSAIGGRVVKAYGDGGTCEVDCGIVGATVTVVAAPPEGGVDPLDDEPLDDDPPADDPLDDEPPDDDPATEDDEAATEDVEPAPTEVVAETVTGRDGRFGLDGLTAGAYELRVQAPGYEPTTQPFVVGAAGGAGVEATEADGEPLEIALDGTPITLRGRMLACPQLAIGPIAVTDSGRPATVTVTDSTGMTVSSWTGRVDEPFVLDDVPGPGFFTISYAGTPATGRRLFVDPVAGPFDLDRGVTSVDRPCA